MSDTLQAAYERLEEAQANGAGTQEIMFAGGDVIRALEAELRERDAELAQARAAVDTVRTFAEHEQVVEYKTLSIQETAGYQLAMRRVLHQLAQATAQPADGQQQAGG